MPGRPELAARLVAAVIAVAGLGVAWSELFVPVETGRIIALCALALVPAVAGAIPNRRRFTVPIAGLLAIVIGAALAAAVSPIALVVEPSIWRTVADVIPGGLEAASSNDLPIAAAQEPQLAGLLLLALLVLAAAAAWQAGARGTPVGTVIALGVGLAYRWTVLPPEQPLVAGAVALVVVVAIVALLAGTRPRAIGPRVAGASTLGAIALAVGVLGGGPASSDRAWLDWNSWNLASGDRSETAALDLEQRYGQLDWPESPRVVLRVTSPRRLHLRAASLEAFDGIAFGLGHTGAAESLPVQNNRIIAAATPADEDTHTQEVELASTRSNLLLAPGRPLGFFGDVGDFAERLGESIRVEPGLDPSARYAVTSTIPDERPATLLESPPPSLGEVGEHLTQVRAGPGGHVVDVPLWGSGMSLPSADEFGPYAGVAALAREITADADSQYAAVNLIEAHVRSEYAYDEQPPFPRGGALPISDFVANSQRGFCQHFAGTMGVMLRSMGIPTRVAVGYTGGRYEPARGEWAVIDRDAHSWVEVYFSGHGWVPFDPTPGRAVASPASVSSPAYAPIDSAVEDGVVEQAVEPTSPEEEVATGPAAEPIEDESLAGGPASGGDDDFWAGAGAVSMIALALAGALGVAALTPWAARRLRRSRERRTGAPRERVLAAASDIERELGRHGITVSPSATPDERADLVCRATGVDATALYQQVARARYAPRGRHPLEPDDAWQTSDAVRRRLRRRRRSQTARGLRAGTLRQ